MGRKVRLLTYLHDTFRNIPKVRLTFKNKSFNPMSAVLPSCLRVGRFVLDNGGSLTRGIYRRIGTRSLISSDLNLRRRPNFLRFSTQPEDKKSQADTREEEKNEKPSNDFTKQIDELKKTVEELSKQKDDMNDKYKRALAESENMRKRLMKQIDEAKIYGIQSFCKDLLEVADVLAKATECVPKEEVSDSNPHLKNLYEGLTMTEAELQKVFKRHGLQVVNPLDEKFDPNLHEALFQQEVEGKKAGTVVVVSKIGYKLHERVVRPALVGVAKG